MLQWNKNKQTKRPEAGETYGVCSVIKVQMGHQKTKGHVREETALMEED